MKSLCKLVLLTAIALLACPAAAADQLALRVQTSHELIWLELANNGKRQASVSEGYALSGLSGGNVVPLVVTNFGQLIPPCGHMDYFQSFRRPKQLGSGKKVTVWKGTASIIAGLHCLEAGRYTLAFMYISPSGELVFSESRLTVVVADGFNAKLAEEERAP